MNVRTVPRAAIKTSLRLARTPFDAATLLLPGGEERTGLRNSAKLAIDQADAAALRFAGQFTLDSGLLEDARRRREALEERRRAARLHGQAEERTERAEVRLEETRDRADSRRESAGERAQSKKARAQRTREQREQRAAKAEQQRKQTSRRIEATREQQIEEEAPKGRLEVLDAKAEALAEREKALTEQDEAQRLAETAAAVKEQRKQS